MISNTLYSPFCESTLYYSLYHKAVKTILLRFLIVYRTHSPNIHTQSPTAPTHVVATQALAIAPILRNLSRRPHKAISAKALLMILKPIVLVVFADSGALFARHVPRFGQDGEHAIRRVAVAALVLRRRHLLRLARG